MQSYRKLFPNTIFRTETTLTRYTTLPLMPNICNKEQCIYASMLPHQYKVQVSDQCRY